MAESNGAVVFITYIGLIMMISAVAGAILAGIKNRDYSFWIAWTFLFPPSLLVLVVLPKLKGPRPRRPTIADEEKRLDDI